MAERKSFLIRVDPSLLLELQRWADDDLRSLNGQIEFLLRKALSGAGRKITQKQNSSPTNKTGESS
ncbi:MAG: hypothetical protein EXS11_07990 [Gemmataceae bacterium]|nr:hypothetical protein [Gemmataceae bacterium]